MDTHAMRKILKMLYLNIPLFFAMIFLSLLFFPNQILAASAGSIDVVNHYAWGENVGWIDFNSAFGSTTVTNSALTGYGYGENIGWISLNCSNTSSCSTVDYKVTNSNGALSGYGWGENVGWIDFKPTGGGVTIDASGVFHGSAYGENIGWIIFNCADTSSCSTVDYKVITSWRPLSTGGNVSGSGSGGGGGIGIATTTLATTATTTLATTTPSLPVSSSAQYLAAKLAVNSRNLFFGRVGKDVRLLQQFLNAVGFPLASSGPGSPGKETTYFGTLTRKALATYQKAVGIRPAFGYFGPKTRAFLKSLGKKSS